MQLFKRLLASSPLHARLAGGLFWSLSGAVVSRSFTLLASIIVSRHLGAEGFGELGILQNTVNMMGELAGLGVGLAATKFVAQYRQSDPGRAARILSLNLLLAAAAGLLLSAGFFLAAGPLAAQVFERASLEPLLQIGALILLASAVNGAVLGALTGFEAFQRIARLNVISGVASLGLQFALVQHWQLQGVMVALLLAQLVALAAGAFMLARCLRESGMRLQSRGLGAELRQLYQFNLPALLSSLMVLPVNWLCSLMLVKQPGGYVEMGLFNAANQWRMALLFIPTSLAAVVLPMLASMAGGGNMGDYRRVLRLNLLVNAALGALMIGGVLLFSSHIMAAYGSGFASGAQVLNVLIVAAGLMAVNNVVGQAISSLGALWTGFAFNLAWALVLLAAAFVLVRGQGALGLALATLVAYGAHTVWQFAFMRAKMSHLS